MTTIMLVILVKQYETSHNLPFLGKSGDVYCIFLGMAITILFNDKVQKTPGGEWNGQNGPSSARGTRSPSLPPIEQVEKWRWDPGNT
jgi:hypothetical protein